MSKLERQRLFLKFLSLGVLLVCLGLLTYGANVASTGSLPPPQAEPPTVSVETQPGAPLRISFQRYDMTRPAEPEVVLDVVNIGDKAIRAYTLSKTMVKGVEKSNGATISDMYLTNSTLRPGQLTTDSITPAPSDKPTRIIVAIDFVEFADGTTWGADQYKANDMLGGRRDGTREATKHLVKILEREGLQAVMDEASTGGINLTPPAGHSPKWEEGFRDGLRYTSSQLNYVFKNGGLPQVEVELRRLQEKTGRR